MDRVDKLATAQFVLACTMAFCSAVWGFVTYTGEQNRLKQQQLNARLTVQNEAIAEMSRQLDLMEAQCPNGEALTVLGENPQKKLHLACFEAYLTARSLIFSSQVSMGMVSTTNSTWLSLWQMFRAELETAGVEAYRPRDVSKKWRQIVDATKNHLVTAPTEEKT